LILVRWSSLVRIVKHWREAAGVGGDIHRQLGQAAI
jgi:hypothetical protein